MSQASEQFESTLHQRLKQSELFRIYQDAFRTATGLPLRLVGAEPEAWCLDEQSTNRSPFCEALNLCEKACQACIETNRRLMSQAEADGPASCHCFAGLCASAVPVMLGAKVVGYLKTGQVFSRQPTDSEFEQVLGRLGRKTLSPEATATLRKAYFQTRTVDPERYNSMITLLNSFGQQLSRHAESLALIEEGSEPAAIVKARNYIHSHLDESLPLGAVAREAGLSESHFCRIFKETTGLTLTDYVNRSRIEWAKRELLKPERRVSEIAFEVGYQSLSQFNRSFARITGQSPTQWRKEAIEEAAPPAREAKAGRKLGVEN